jgi:Mn2+/Fe2+ NRAMP family transporter
MADSQFPLPEDHDTLPPEQDPAAGDGTVEPPRDFFGIIKRLGPGLIIAGSIVGSGELIATTKTGAQAGILLLWLIVIGCLIKVFVQIELGRYTIGHGETTLSALDQVPGPRLRVNWIVWFWLLMMLLGIGQLGGIVGGVGQAAALAIPITGDYDEATKYPSGNEIKTYLKWDDAVLSVWDFRTNSFVDVPPGLVVSPVIWEASVSSRRKQLIGWVAKRDKTLADRITQVGDELSGFPGEKGALDPESVVAKLSPLLDKANQLLIEETSRGIINDEALKKLVALNDARRERIIRGHALLSRRLLELDDGLESRVRRAVIAVDELIRREREVTAMKAGKPTDGLSAKTFHDILANKPVADTQEYTPLDIELAEVEVENQKNIVATILDPPTWDDKIWAALVALFTSMLLYRGRYGMIQNVSTFLVVVFTFITIGNVVALQMTDQWHISFSQILDGLSFKLPEASESVTPLATALATFGIIGVGASELIAYPYWCLEKGYAKYTGKRTADENWARRARGWMKVMHYDAFVSMIVYTLATLAFFWMGVAVLYNEGRDPDGMRMVSTLSRSYVPVFGEYARWLFLVGAVAVLYSTFLVATASNARMYTDSLKIYGFMGHHNQKAHDRSVSFFSVLLPFLCLAVFCSGANPVRMILLSGAMQALLLPMIGFGALYFRYTRTDGRIKPGPLWDALLIVSFLGLFVAGTYGAWEQIKKFF